MYDYYIGIDPGLSGAVSVIEASTNSIVDIQDAPIMQVPTGKKLKSGKPQMKKLFIDSQMVEILRPYADLNVLTTIEKVHAMPKQGVVSVFSFGEGYGIWKGICATLGLSRLEVPPVTWKKALMKGMSKEKSASVYKAQQLYPDGDFYDEKGKALDGRGDATLIALYGMRDVTGQED